MIPKKIHWMLGYDSLAVILEQDRKHWLMKTDKKKQIQDKLTGDLFQGQIDNLGTDIIVESRKLPYKFDFINEIKFQTSGADKVFGINNSVFPHSSSVNGLMFMRILSTNFPKSINGELRHNHYKIRFYNAEKCIIPFASSSQFAEVYASKWLKTTTPPSVMIVDDKGFYSIEEQLKFSPNITNAVYYYPLSENLQTVNINHVGKYYDTDAINNNGFIGYPIIWFTCDQTNIGSTLEFENNINNNKKQIMFISNEGNTTKFNAKIYTGIDGEFNATPDETETTNFVIKCSCKSGERFINSNSDFSKELDPESINVYNISEQKDHFIPFKCNESDIITMSKDVPWEYVDDSTYQIEMSYFDINCLENESDNPLISIFDVHFDENVPFTKKTDDVGYAGLRIGSSNLTSDVYNKYPYDLNKWNGLPEWMNEMDASSIPEHVVVYAVHDTPNSSPDPSSKQTAALILDAGKPMTYHDIYDDEGNVIVNNDEIGRVYIISNDDLEYKNNSKTEYPKPARTAARICDIPTSVMQLTGVKGLSPTQVVDKKYVRTEASFTEEDKDRLYNTISTRWVRPTALSKDGKPVWEAWGFPNKYVFQVKTLPDGTILNSLDDVDLVYHNDFRYHVNLNPMVDVNKVHIAGITNAGNNYAVDDIGCVVVGGFSFTYVVIDVNSTGGVTKLELIPDDNVSEINISNFDLNNNLSGTTEPYGTSPKTGKGTGLKIKLYIEYDHFHEIITTKGEIFNDIFALVNKRDGLYLYTYTITDESSTPKTGKWEEHQLISQYEYTDINKINGGVSTQESFINSIIPSIRIMPINYKNNNEEPTTITALQTASFVNIVDKNKTPVRPVFNSDNSDNFKDRTTVDLCKFYCEGFNTAVAPYKTIKGIIDRLNELNELRFDSYIAWKWNNMTDPQNMEFTYGIISRSFNNLMTTDTTTTLPASGLKCDNFIHTNGNTTVVWDVPNIGVMMWIYNPSYTKKENYFIDAETRDLHVTKDEMTFKNIDIRADENGNIQKIVNENGILQFNILTNNPMSVDSSKNGSAIYQQPDYIQYDDLMMGQSISRIHKNHNICGNWQLVFPRIQSFRLTNDITNTEWIPMKMQVIKGRDIDESGTVTDEFGNDVNAKSVIISENDDSVSMKMFNSKIKKWIKI